MWGKNNRQYGVATKRVGLGTRDKWRLWSKNNRVGNKDNRACGVKTIGWKQGVKGGCGVKTTGLVTRSKWEFWGKKQ